MRFTLPESARRPSRSMGGTLLSAVLHAGVIGGTIAATGWSAERIVKPRAEEVQLVYVAPKETTQPPAPAPSAPPRPRPPAVTPPQVTVPVPEVVATVPTIVPAELPPVTAPLGTIASSDTTTAAASGTGTDSTVAGLGSGSGGPYTELTVERAVVPRGGVTPRYPPQLASAGVEGLVEMEFVVDTLGRVERESVRALRADHPQFEQSVRDALQRMRFIPAEVGGRRVRQLVQQPFTFAIRTN